VLPYKFLSAFQKEAASHFLENIVDVWISTLNATDFRGSSVPDELLVDEIIPDLLFLTIDALSALMEKQKPRLANLCRKGLISRFVVDEIHTLLVEDFRSVYQCLQQLPSFGVPILTISGSLPKPFRSTLLGYVGMQHLEVPIGGTNGVKLISDGDILGGFPSNWEVRIAFLITSTRLVPSRRSGHRRSARGRGPCGASRM
jgi:hypothetical protein